MAQAGTHTVQVTELGREPRAHFIMHWVYDPGQVMFMSLNLFTMSWF